MYVRYSEITGALQACSPAELTEKDGLKVIQTEGVCDIYFSKVVDGVLETPANVEELRAELDVKTFARKNQEAGEVFSNYIVYTYFFSKTYLKESGTYNDNVKVASIQYEIDQAVRVKTEVGKEFTTDEKIEGSRIKEQLDVYKAEYSAKASLEELKEVFEAQVKSQMVAEGKF